MLTHRYTRWDGSQRLRLDADQIFAKLGEYLSYTDDLRQALDWLLRHGLDLEDSVRVVGLDEVLEELREQMRRRYHEFNFAHALDDVQRKLDELLDLERAALDERRGDRPELDEKREFLDRLPRRLSDAIERLREYEFEDVDAAGDFQNLLEELDNVRRLEDFIRRHGDLFQGPKSLDYERALELIDEM